MPVRAWRLSPFLTGEVFVAWTLWLVVLAPLAEEMLFRGDLFSRLRVLLPPAATVAVGALVFGLCHAERGLLQPVSVLPLGVALGAMRLWTGSLWPCIALHALSNGAVVLARVWSTG
nr:CPBP family intramembrane glutamic endopeptidase [Methylobacterium ajmalii]